MMIQEKKNTTFNGLIERIWMMPKKTGTGHRVFTIMPDGNFDLVFILNETHCNLLYTGPFTVPRRVPFFEQHEYFCVRFRPGIMPRVADIAATDLVNSWEILPTILGTRTDEIGERLFSAKGFDEKVKVIETFFRKSRLEHSLPKFSFLNLTRRIEKSHGVIRVDDLARDAGISTRTLERLFLDQTGLAPKTFFRMVRFQHVLARLNQGSYANFADLALECGYTDQSHFIRDFKHLAHCLPSRA